MAHRAKHRNIALLRRALTGRRTKHDVHTEEGQQRMLAALTHIARERMQKP